MAADFSIAHVQAGQKSRFGALYLKHRGQSSKQEGGTMRRKITEKMLEWKRSGNGKTALLIDGARLVGKSYTLNIKKRRTESIAYNLFRSCVNSKGD